MRVWGRVHVWGVSGSTGQLFLPSRGCEHIAVPEGSSMDNLCSPHMSERRAVQGSELARSAKQVYDGKTRAVKGEFSYVEGGVVQRGLWGERASGERRQADPDSFLPYYRTCYSGAETREERSEPPPAMQTPPGSPFAEVIASLAGLHQQHHQALLGLREDQERRFQALVQTQQEDREAFRSWASQERGPSETSTASPTIPLHKMGPHDEPEAFLELFERSAELSGWQPDAWAARLIPLLSGEAQLAAQQLPVANLLQYADLKRAILERVGLSPEQHRQRFRSLELGDRGQPFAFAHQLRDACHRWLMAGANTTDDLVEKVTLEQFVGRLPRKTAQWVQCHRPSTLAQAIQLAEDQLVACPRVGGPLMSSSLSLPVTSPPLPSRPVPFPRTRGTFPPRPAPRTRRFSEPGPTGAARSSDGAGSWLNQGSNFSSHPSTSQASPRQFGGLPPAARAAGTSGPACWRCGDPGHFIDRCPMMEVGMMIRVPDNPQAALGQDGLYQIPVSIRGGTYQALVDSGCNLTSIHQSLTQFVARDTGRMVKVPFERIGMDLIGPLERSARGHRFALVIVDYATRYPEAVALRNISATSVADALFRVISRVGIPKEVLTDQGTAFMSRTLRELYGLLGIKTIRTSVYHPQTDGLVERFNRTLKTMIRKFLLYGRQPRGVLDVLREAWEDGPSASKNQIQYVLDLRTKLHTLGRLSMENLLQAQDRQSRQYNRGARLRKFTPGEKVLVLLPTSSSKLLAKWQGPFEVTRRVGDLNYEVVRSDRSGAHQIYHLNLLKKWSEANTVMLATTVSREDDLGPEVNTKVQSLALAPGGDHLSSSQVTDVVRLQAEFADVFSPLPGRTNLIEHHIETKPGAIVRSRPYRLPEHKKMVVQKELEAMLDMGVIEESSSDWASPIVLVPKTDGSVRFCVDYRKVNAVSKFDAYPMPRIDELLDRLGTARFYSTLDLTKGYWQIPLSPLSKEKTAFTTPFGLHQFATLPFGLFGAPATFQRLMDRILRPHSAYAAAYLDDIIIYSNDWERHMQHLRAVLASLRGAGLTANPKKCAVGRVEVRYLGFHLGHGEVRPQINKTAAIATAPRPKTKKEVRQFLGLAGYYRRFVPNYSDLTSPLTDLTKKGAPDTVQWTEQCQQGFTKVKAALCGGPLLHSPDFSISFLLQTDASDRGVGAVLSQEVGGEDRPVLYISRKLSQRETKYSTIEKECLAIRWAVLTLRYYLLGREFTLCSDHAPLQWLHRMKDTNARITRWYLALQPFKFKVIHRPGTQMAVADFLSRRGGGKLQAGWGPGLSRAVGVCGKGGVVQRGLWGERASGERR
ncbi:uncharacterized protein LOC130406867 [Triplophysa dalaica]|uniref:uncharacterized protein LOC130406867 n=1 Tax=Triplophysa dalaica TaxID=1582913 RepID=UPI0024DF418C|nr:uncharacterized protein LOC130406867 [Triplophysa dalaica]